MGLVLVSLLYLSNFYSAKIAYIFNSDLSLQKMFSLSIEFYFLSFVTFIFLIIWIATFTRSTLLFFNKIFTFEKQSTFINVLFKINVFFLSFVVYIYLDFFLPNSYLLTGLFFIFKLVANALAVQFAYFPLIITLQDYQSFASILLLSGVAILSISFFVLFVLHLVYFYLRRNNLDEFFAWNYTFQIGKSLLFCFVPFLFFFLILLYNSITDIVIKLSILMAVILLILWFVYKITSTYYYGVTNSFLNDEFSANIFILVALLFYVIPLILWYLSDFYYIYILHTLQNTAIFDFKNVLLSNNLITSDMLAKPYLIDPYFLLFLSMVVIPRILLFDILLSALISLAVIIKMQYSYIITYFRSKFNQTFRESLENENTTIGNFNAKIQNSIFLHFLFILFIVFLIWDVILVTYTTFIMPLDPSLFPNFSHVIIITLLLSFIDSLRTILSINGVLFLIILFVAVLVVFNIVSIKLNEKNIEHSIFGVNSLVSVSFILINAFLLYDLYNSGSVSLNSFKTIFIASFIGYSYHWLVTAVIFCDSLFVLYTLLIIGKKGKKRLKRRVQTNQEANTLQEQKVSEAEIPMSEEEQILRQELEHEEA